jgi:opacity protein-like surface antigen
MKTILRYFVLGAGLLAAAPAVADGWYRGGGSYKDSVAVPVPVPAPIPDYAARWYLRADLGLGFASSDPSESGIVYGQNLYPPQDTSSPFRTPSQWSDDDIASVFSYGAGFGYYWSPRFRTDLTFEGRTERDIKIRGTYDYQQEYYDLGTTSWQPTGAQVFGETRDDAKLSSGLVLFNAYYDFVRAGPLTPYIGAGVGFAVNKLQRNFANQEYICAGLNCLGPWSSLARDSSYDVTFAAAISAGLSYSISPVTMLDVGYRYLYIGSSDIDLTINGVKSNFSTGDTHEHQIRAGLRWNIQ